jgi:acyl-[acyl-carrier-protein]-phospholipid O-acyltransferase/long-chain-fatty-acid--[acyl-carrier-protein] ligase
VSVLLALNDNFVRNMLVTLILFWFGGESASHQILATIVFILPSIPLSALGGEIADSHDKAVIARQLKFVEIFVEVIAAAGFAFLFAAAALCGAVRARGHRGPVRPDQIWRPA